MALHKVGLKPESRFAAAGASNDEHVLITRRLRVFGSVVHGQALRLREDDVVLEVGINIRRNVFCLLRGLSP